MSEPFMMSFLPNYAIRHTLQRWGVMLCVRACVVSVAQACSRHPVVHWGPEHCHQHAHAICDHLSAYPGMSRSTCQATPVPFSHPHPFLSELQPPCTLPHERNVSFVLVRLTSQVPCLCTLPCLPVVYRSQGPDSADLAKTFDIIASLMQSEGALEGGLLLF
jgi:hypothetical protein